MNAISAAERRALLNSEKDTRMDGDLVGIIPSITGKIELV
jgi:magnesium chelatase subunit I